MATDYYVFIDTVNGNPTGPTNTTPNTATSKYHTNSAWPQANGARWKSLSAAALDTTIQNIFQIASGDGIHFICKGGEDSFTPYLPWHAYPNNVNIEVVGA